MQKPKNVMELRRIVREARAYRRALERIVMVLDEYDELELLEASEYCRDILSKYGSNPAS